MPLRPYILVFLFLPPSLIAQDAEFLHLELTWQTIESDHFLVHYHQGIERTAREVVSIAEQIYQPITALYRHEPDQKVSIVLRDHDDYSNGAAYFYDNKIEIWVPAMDFELRGIHPWLKNVVTHEFTHIVQIQTAMKLGRRVPAIYFQWFGYEAERRPDVLYGFPNVLVSYPFSAFVVPIWFAEGTAQLNHPDLEYDFWDTHRDMILRMSMIDGTTLSWEEMAVFGKTSLGNEAAYNAGFSIVRYIAERFGREKLVEISRSLSALPRLTIDGAIEAALGKTGEALYSEWKHAMTGRYEAVSVGKERTPGEPVEREGFGNFYPAFSPDGQRIAYVSNKGEDFFSPSSIYLYDRSTKATERLTKGVRSTLSFSPDARFLYYARASRRNPNWSSVYDLYRYDLKAGREERLTFGLRARNPRLSPDGTRIVFAYGSDGTLNIGVADSEGKNVRQITSFKNGEQVFTPTWSPDGKTIAFGYSHGHRQSVATIGEDGSGFRVVVAADDSRNPFFTPDGKYLLFSSDRSGIFNLYSLDLESQTIIQLTDILGGAFFPVANRGGEIAYVSYESTGFKIACLPANRRCQDTITVVSTEAKVPEDISTLPNPPELQADPPAFQGPRAYRNVFSSLSIIPVLRVDNYNPKNKGLDILRPGLYISSNDMLDKLGLFAGAALNRKFERDVFLIFEYRDRLPLLYQIGLDPILSLELYSISRKTSTAFQLPPAPQDIPVDITYGLFEFDVSLRQRAFTEKTEFRLWYALSRYAVDIGSYVNPNDFTLASAFRNVYLIGNLFAMRLAHRDIEPSVDSEINPVGRSFSVQYGYESNKFNPRGDFDLSDGIPVPIYENFMFHRLDVRWDEHLALPFDRHTVSFGIRRTSILGKPVDPFFDSYGGGFFGMRGYPFYALGGNDATLLSLTYRFPIFKSIKLRLFQFSFTKLYGSVFGDIGDAWSGSPSALHLWKKDMGFELRLEAFSFYAYPTRIFFSGAYGFDRFTKSFGGVPVNYGGEWRFYFGVLFGFEIREHRRMYGKEIQ